MQPGLFTFGAEATATPYDVAVVMPSLLRPSLFQALVSIFRQEGVGRVQILIGVDQAPADEGAALRTVAAACRMSPPEWTVQLLWPGYSTSTRHGGVTAARDGGALRAILSFMAHAPLVAYLDDDNWWRPDHLAGLVTAIEGREWAWAWRWFVHPRTHRPVCVDRWESVGPGQGVFADSQGGFVDPNCLMIDKTRVPDVLARWTTPMPGDPTFMTADRMVFDFLQHRPGGCSGRDSVFYVLRESDGLHPLRLRMMGEDWGRAEALAG
ncbi:glycosyltransferase family protein [Acidomonas methanolica]|uniref:Glycosyltransferase n=2 Tax=Acidomonas methanolica TaxID=437 RepID=A0A023D0V1_ACIMT|nr:glycosyl transferase [Acidomonas methanolica]MBU2653420.1 glycosyltransferase family 2 protein [Acidomonas methanolica]TCS32372.1 hypothetical protein EDC31_101312 [Acidomonas methanolica]GAJ27747.1 hypothetical protein Amme_005_135 [Acidomonas methanolica NBRC 104435]GEK97809.1 hypothetical protein AME01nite_03080 [Acidomonas methanolica NBRC 104435]